MPTGASLMPKNRVKKPLGWQWAFAVQQPAFGEALVSDEPPSAASLFFLQVFAVSGCAAIWNHKERLSALESSY
jgi:hypothetical protein